jgi:DUF1707 SHOCT-like domain
MSQHFPVWTDPRTGRPARTGPVRIGDAERDEAVSALAEHFVAGRLTQEEFDERSDQATRARYAGDLVPLFADLPDPAAPAPGPRGRFPGGRQGPPPFVWLAPVLMVGLMLFTAVMLTAPWMLWMLFWVFLFSGGTWGRRWHGGGRHPRRR